MDPLVLARLQFAVTTVYHFFFVPLTLGLSIFVAIMQTAYARTGNETYKKMAKFWGKLFLINFAMGVVTGIVQEFQFGMNWSEYSRFMGDIFGAPLAIEALLAFFLESIFIGVWVFGEDRLPKWAHAASIWAVAVGSNISALWILIANSFMQQPVGYAIEGGRAVMTDFFALLTNPNVWVQYPHVLTSGMSTAAFFVLGISAWHLLRRTENYMDVFRTSFRWATVYGLIAVLGVMFIGHSQMQHMVQVQPMKVAAAEGLFESEDPAGLSLFTIGTLDERQEVFSIRVPYLLSILAYNRLDGEVKGFLDLQAEYEERFGEGQNYIPPVAINYWSFRAMVGAGTLMLLLALYSFYLVRAQKYENASRLLKWLPFAILLPYIANSTGWILAEVGRQPWIVFGLQRVEDAVSPNVTVTDLLISLIAFTLVYGLLMVVDIFLLRYFAMHPDHVFFKAAEEDPALEAVEMTF
ncbi:MAG: cytochrome ubiquinol oxidase subunit I [Anaerolineae bacterium]